MTCDVCKRDRETHVASSTTGAISFAFCNECLQNNAEPEWTLEYLYSDVGHKGEGLADWVKQLKTYKDDKYINWDEWFDWRRLPEQAHFDEEHEKQLNEYFSAMADAEALTR